MPNGYAQPNWNPMQETHGVLLGAKTSEPPRQPLLSEIRDEISTATKEILSLVDTCHGAADNLFGAQPQVPSGNQNATPTMGRVGEICDHLVLLHGAISLLRSEIFRLQSL